jgi:hypothetical protein
MSKFISSYYYSKTLKLGLVLAISLSLGLSTGSAGWFDPANLQVGGSVPPPGNDPNQISSPGLVDIYEASNANAATFSQFLLILGIPEKTSNNNFFSGNNPITSVTSYSSSSPPVVTKGSSTLGGTNPFSQGSWNTSSGYAGTMTSSGEAYSTAGFSNTDNSNSFVNWAYGGGTSTKPTGGDLGINGINPNGFDLYVFVITASLDPQGYVSVQFNTDPTKGATLPLGTYAIAYADVTDSNGNVKLYDTPFTQAGLTTSNGTTPGGGVITNPAPSSAVLFSLGGLALLGFMARSRRRLLAAA